MMRGHKSRQKLKNAQIANSVEGKDFEGTNIRLSALMTPNGIVSIRQREKSFYSTSFRFIYGGYSYKMAYYDRLPDSVIEEIALQWVDEIIKANQ